jgi:hypothetical protein
VPLHGHVDDLLTVPAGLVLALYLIPDELLRELRDEASKMSRVARDATALIVRLVR